MSSPDAGQVRRGGNYAEGGHGPTPGWNTGSKAASAAFNALMQPLSNLQGEYPWAYRFITYVRVVAKVFYVLGVLQAGCTLFAGIFISLRDAKDAGSFLGGTAGAVGGVVFSVVLAVGWYLLVWLGYMFLMALPDFLECLLRIETNTRTQR